MGQAKSENQLKVQQLQGYLADINSRYANPPQNSIDPDKYRKQVQVTNWVLNCLIYMVNEKENIRKYALLFWQGDRQAFLQAPNSKKDAPDGDDYYKGVLRAGADTNWMSFHVDTQDKSLAPEQAADAVVKELQDLIDNVCAGFQYINSLEAVEREKHFRQVISLMFADDTGCVAARFRNALEYMQTLVSGAEVTIKTYADELVTAATKDGGFTEISEQNEADTQAKMKNSLLLLCKFKDHWQKELPSDKAQEANKIKISAESVIAYANFIAVDAFLEPEEMLKGLVAQQKDFATEGLKFKTFEEAHGWRLLIGDIIGEELELDEVPNEGVGDYVFNASEKLTQALQAYVVNVAPKPSISAPASPNKNSGNVSPQPSQPIPLAPSALKPEAKPSAPSVAKPDVKQTISTLNASMGSPKPSPVAPASSHKKPDNVSPQPSQPISLASSAPKPEAKSPAPSVAKPDVKQIISTLNASMGSPKPSTIAPASSHKKPDNVSPQPSQPIPLAPSAPQPEIKPSTVVAKPAPQQTSYQLIGTGLPAKPPSDKIRLKSAVADIAVILQQELQQRVEKIAATKKVSTAAYTQAMTDISANLTKYAGHLIAAYVSGGKLKENQVPSALTQIQSFLDRAVAAKIQQFQPIAPALPASNSAIPSWTAKITSATEKLAFLDIAERFVSVDNAELVLDDNEKIIIAQQIYGGNFTAEQYNSLFENPTAENKDKVMNTFLDMAAQEHDRYSGPKPG